MAKVTKPKKEKVIAGKVADKMVEAGLKGKGYNPSKKKK
jgi:hypothetical protein